MSHTHLYATLPSARSIRLLRLQPGLGEHQLVCSLEVVEDFETGPAYHALSYCWGDPQDVVEILCNQQSIHITRNLCAALHRLKKRGQDLPIWADAICIDQKNVAERNQQVSIMDQIFSNASMVYAWLGISDANTSRAITIIKRIVQRIHATSRDVYQDNTKFGLLAELTALNARNDIDSWVTRLSTSNYSIAIIHALANLKVTDFDDQDWKAFYKFYEAEWFSRVWVIQEVQHAKDARLLCGDFELPWNWAGFAAAKVRADALVDHVIDWERSSFPSLQPFLNAEVMWNRVHWTPMQDPFLTLLDTVRSFRATDPRDKVFALLHHRVKQNVIDDVETILHSKVLSDPSMKSPSSTHLNLEADYRMTLLHVYREVAVQSIQCYGNLEVLTYAWQTAPYDTLWPSWIPRWDISCDLVAASLWPFLFDADRQHRAECDVYYSSNSLKIHGFQIGTICEKTSTLKYPVTENASIWAKKDKVKDNLMTMLRLITRDCRQATRFENNDACRAGDYGFMPTHFSDFCTFGLQHLNSRKQDCYISLYDLWCDMCNVNLSSFGGGPVISPVNIYHCPNENFDICSSCFQKGVRHPDASRTLQSTSPTYMWLPYTRDVLRTLEKYAGDGQSERLQHQAATCCRRIAFFQTAEGNQGSASENIELGDVVVVLLGSRVPIILRKHGSAYRLVSDAYVDGFMDGKAIDMWQDGELEERSFEVR